MASRLAGRFRRQEVKPPADQESRDQNGQEFRQSLDKRPENKDVVAEMKAKPWVWRIRTLKSPDYQVSKTGGDLEEGPTEGNSQRERYQRHITQEAL
jgi:hypothetical protein